VRLLTADIDSNTRPTEQERGGVRFKAEDEEIQPVQAVASIAKPDKKTSIDTEELTPEAHEQIRSLAMTLQKSRIQESRMANFAYEPVSMPPSRVRAVIFPSTHLQTNAVTANFERK
jgi:hypothetical protein